MYTLLSTRKYVLFFSRNGYPFTGIINYGDAHNWFYGVGVRGYEITLEVALDILK
jgi:hypothetical protein